MDLTLVVLAAGASSRFGSVKQLTPVGPAGESLVDYAIFDARRAGFSRVVLIIRRQAETSFRETLGRRLTGRLPVVYAHQRLDDVLGGFRLPRERDKPWGTGQAVLAAAEAVRGPFAVVNGDDFYGADAFAAMSTFLRRPLDQIALGSVTPRGALPTFAMPTFAMVGYRLGDTLSDAGTVSRGVCRSDREGWLQEIVEILAVARCDRDGDYRDGVYRDGVYWDESGRRRVLAGDTLVSRNFWGFTPELFPLLRRGFQEFLAAEGRQPTAEFLLPACVGALVRQGRVRVKVLPGGKETFGMTYQGDTAEVRERIAGLIARGDYPEALWT